MLGELVQYLKSCVSLDYFAEGRVQPAGESRKCVWVGFKKSDSSRLNWHIPNTSNTYILHTYQSLPVSVESQKITYE